MELLGFLQLSWLLTLSVIFIVILLIVMRVTMQLVNQVFSLTIESNDCEF